MFRKKVLSVGVASATMLVEDTDDNNTLRALKRINVSGWSAEDVSAMQQMFQDVYDDRVSGMVEVHTILLQNGFLNVVTTYCPKGDVDTYVEEELEAALSEAECAKWLFIAAYAVKRIHSLGHPHAGVSLDRLLLAPPAPGREKQEQAVVLGLPNPLTVYYKALRERESEGVKVQFHYPPEVVTKGKYHPTSSDVWHLGQMMMRLLSARTSYSSRTKAIRALVDAMMAPDPSKRLTVSTVLDELKKICGAKVPTVPNLYTPAEKRALSPKRVNSSGQQKPAQARGAAVASTPPPEPPRKRTNSPPPVVLTALTPPTRRYESTVNSDGPSAPPPEEDDVDIVSSATARPTGTIVDGKRWRARAMAQFDELQRMNASPPANMRRASPGAPRSRGGDNLTTRGHTTTSPPPVRPDYIEEEIPERAVRSPMLKGRERPNVQSPRSPGKRVSPRSPGKANSPEAIRHARFHPLLAGQEEQLRKRDDLKRELDEKRRKQEFEEQRAQNTHKSHKDQMKRIKRGESGNRGKNIRKSIKMWRAQNKNGATDSTDNVVLAADGVSIFAKNDMPPSSNSSFEESDAPPKPQDPLSPKGEEEEEPPTPVSPAEPVSPLARSGRTAVVIASKRPGHQTPRTKPRPQGSNNSSEPASVMSRTSDDLTKSKNGQDILQGAPARPPRGATPNRIHSSSLQSSTSIQNPPHIPRTRLPSARSSIDPAAAKEVSLAHESISAATPKKSSVRSIRVVDGDANGDNSPAPLTPQPDPDSDQRFAVPASLSVSKRSAERHVDANESKPNVETFMPTRTNSALQRTGATILATVEWSVDSIKHSIRILVKDPTLYSETLEVVDAFVRLPNEERHKPQFNAVFMKTLKELYGDSELLTTAGPLCCQLAALTSVLEEAKEREAKFRARGSA